MYPVAVVSPPWSGRDLWSCMHASKSPTAAVQMEKNDAPSRGDNLWLAERGSRETPVHDVAARLIREGQGEAT